MTRQKPPPPGYGTNKVSPQPERRYHVPGGPYAADLGEVEMKKLAEIERGGSEDRGYGAKR